MARNDGFESGNAVRIGFCDPAKEGRVDVARVGRVAVATGDNARVYASGIAVPVVYVDIWDRLAGVDIDDLDVDGQRHTLLVLGDVFADILALDVVRTLGNLGYKDARAIAEEVLLGDIHVDASVVEQMSSVEYRSGITFLCSLVSCQKQLFVL